jgi:hypothetical protein
VAATSAAKVNLGLTFLALLSFTIAFFGARIFTTIHPDIVVVNGGIHFHHFWYGLAMVVTAGWLGIVSTHPELNRIYAIVFGFGGGLIGDEVGLLLTFGNYYSQLTYVFFVAFICFAVLAIVAIRYRGELEDDVLSLSTGERGIHIGVLIAAFSVLAFSFDMVGVGVVIALAGIMIVFVGIVLRKKT